MEYRYKGPGKFWVESAGDVRARKVEVGECVELTDEQYAKNKDRFEAPSEVPAEPSDEEIERREAEVEALAALKQKQADDALAAEEARIQADLEAEAARVAAGLAV